MKVFCTGGCGFTGARLVPQLLAHGYNVTVYDIGYFGFNHMPFDPKLRLIQGDIRDTAALSVAVKDHDAFISLAAISNDACGALDGKLLKSVNLDAFEPMVLAAKRNGIRRFIYASSSSAYGVADPNIEVTEDHPLVPITLYNQYKGECEPLLNKHVDDNFVGVTFRPATVCGYSTRQRLDLLVNIFANQAINKKPITVFGGDQLRPNVHIQDYVDAVELLLTAPAEKVNGEIFNVGYQNLTAWQIADLVRNTVLDEFPEYGYIKIERTESNDKRSYHINSDKISRILGFRPRYSIEDAVRELCWAYREGRLPNSLTDDQYVNVDRLRRLKAA